MERLYDWANKQMEKASVLSHLLKFVVGLCNHWSCELVMFGFELAISIMSGFTYFGIGFWCAVVMLILLMFISALSKEYANRQKKSTQEELDALNASMAVQSDVSYTTAALNGLAANAVFRVARTVGNEGWASLEETREKYSFQNMAFAVCKEIHRLLRSQYGLENHLVTVFQRFDAVKRGKTKPAYCRMIAYANRDRREPFTYSTSYNFSGNEKKGQPIELHTRILGGNDMKPRILLSKEDVATQFKFHSESRPREECIQQYIGIPISVCDNGIVAVLQIDSDVENGFGKDRETVEKLIHEVLKPFVTLLTLCYEIDRLNEMSIINAEKQKMERAG